MPATWTSTRDVQISDLTRFPNNARRGNVEEIRKSLRRHGQYRAIVVRDTGSELVILAGNHTRDALEAEGHTAARCEVIDVIRDVDAPCFVVAALGPVSFRDRTATATTMTLSLSCCPTSKRTTRELAGRPRTSL